MDARVVRANGRRGGPTFRRVMSGRARAQRAAAVGCGALDVLVGPGVELDVTVSIGGAMSRPRAKLDDIIESADKAMYQAKIGGRNRVVMAAPASSVAVEATPKVLPAVAEAG